MRHFDHLPTVERDRLFACPPQEFSRDAELAELAVLLGATLYMPATRPNLAADIRQQARAGVMSSVVCLEDAVRDDDLGAAEVNAVVQLRELAVNGGCPAMVFVRVRNPQQIGQLVEALGDHSDILTGFVLPKFTAHTGAEFLDALQDAETASGHRLLAMPVLESAEMIHLEERISALVAVGQLLRKHRERILAVRIGATDLSAAYGIRRTPDLTVYDARLVSNAIVDIVNILGRADGTGFIVTGPVWEHFDGPGRMFKPQLRQSPFDQHDEADLRSALVTRGLDGLIREVVLDQANGMTGKTVIHPTHVHVVHALSVVPHEQYTDALDVLGQPGGGVAASQYRNKMNEAKPHRSWALRTLRRAAAFGVAAPGVTFVDLLAAGEAAGTPPRPHGPGSGSASSSTSS